MKYSSAPVSPGVSVEEDVYASVIEQFMRDWHVVGLQPQTDTTTPQLGAWVVYPKADIPAHWPDSLRHEVATAFADSALRQPADDSLLGALAAARAPAAPAALPRRTGRLQLRMSRPGFNADSTLAAIRVSYWCGWLCAAGQVWLLARRPGLRWRVWYVRTDWVS